MLDQFPFKIRGFHSGNGSEFINHRVEAILKKLLVEQTRRRVYIHTLITGGQAPLDTLNGFHELAQTTGERNIVV